MIISSTDSLKFNDNVTIQINWQELLNLPQLSLAVSPPPNNMQYPRGMGRRGVQGFYVGVCQRVLAIYLYIIQRFVELNSQSFTGNRNANEALQISASSIRQIY